MIRAGICGVLLGVVVSFSIARGEAPSSVSETTVDFKHLPWPDGEALTYLVSLGAFEAAEGTFVAREKGDHWEFHLALESRGLVDELLGSHLRSLEVNHLLDVESTDQHTVKPWFDGKVDFAPPVRDFATQGFPLLGGRLDVVHGRTIAAVVYGRRKHLVNVFIWPVREQDATARSGSQQGYQWIDWRRGGMEFCAVSDAALSDLEQLQGLFAN